MNDFYPAPLSQRLKQVNVLNVVVAACVVAYLVALVYPALRSDLLFWPPLAYFQPWRFITAAFTHSGLMHLACNLSFLYILGQLGSRLLTQTQLGLLFFLSVWGGSLGTLVWARLTGDLVSTVGASGGVMGVCAGLFIVAYRFRELSAQLGAVLALNFGLGFVLPGVAWHAHLGGALVGLLLGWLYRQVDVVAARRGNAQVDGATGYRKWVSTRRWGTWLVSGGVAMGLLVACGACYA